MKMYDKTDLEYKNGFIVSSTGDIVAVDNAVVDLANELETRVQKAMYLNSQPAPVPMRSLDGFERKSENSLNLFSCETPTLDKSVEEAMLLMNDIDSMSTTNMLNDQLKNYADLVYFVRDKELINCEHEAPRRFDVPTLGNPLLWTEDTLLEFIAKANGVEVEDEKIEDGEQE